MESTKKAKVLLISYAFPPLSGPRSIRWVEFIKILVRKKWKIDVLTSSPSRAESYFDSNSLKEIPENIKVYRIAHRFSNPIGFKYWFVLSLLYGWGLIIKNNYNLIISSSSPGAPHVVAYFLKKWAKLPWVSDYGDPWYFNPADSFPSWEMNLKRLLEEWILKEINKIIVTTEATKVAYLQRFPFLMPDQIKVVPQGFSDILYQNIQEEKFSKFKLVYTGVFYEKVREPFVFFEALKKFENEDIETIIAGNVKKKIISFAENMRLRNKIKFVGFVSRKEVTRLQKGASVLIFLGNNSSYQLPGKIFEYIAAQRPILCISYDKEDDPAAKMIKKLNRGIVVSNNVNDIQKGISKMLSLYRNCNLERSFSLGKIKEFSWEARAKMIRDILEEVIYRQKESIKK